MNDTRIDQALRTLRVIVVAMAMGIVGFSIVAFVVVRTRTTTPQPELVMVLLPAVGGVAFIALVVGTVLRRAICERLRRTPQRRPASGDVREPASGTIRDTTSGELRDMPSGDVPDQVIGTFLTLTLISSALAEGPSLFGVVAFLVTSNWLALVVPLLGLLVLWGLLPSRPRLDRFVADVTGLDH